MSAAPRLRRPGAVTAAAIALAIGGVLTGIQLATNVAASAEQLARFSSGAVVGGIVLLSLQPAGLLLCAWLALQGRRGAKAGATVIAVFAVFAVISVFAGMTAAELDPLAGVTFGAPVVGAALLWIPESRAYARAARAIRSDARAEARMLRSRRPLR
jgi:hypothetical protein